MNKIYIGVDPGSDGFVSVIDKVDFRVSEQQRKSLESLCGRFTSLPKEIQSYILDKTLERVNALMGDYEHKTSSNINQNTVDVSIPADREIWRPITIEGIEDCYQVSNFGRVKHIKKNIDKGGRILKIKENPKVGYMYLTIKHYNKVKHLRVHRLVAQAFIPNPNKYPEVNHKDENKLNNRFDNLEWCTREENSRYGTKQERMLNTRKVRNHSNQPTSIVGIDPKTKEVRVRFESLRDAHNSGYDRFAIRRRVNNCIKTPYKGLIWQKVG